MLFKIEPSYPEPSTLIPLEHYITTKNTLCLNFATLDTGKWEDQFLSIKKIVKAYKINLILIDRTGDPVVIDQALPLHHTEIEKVKQLSKIVDVRLITEDWRYWYQPQTDKIIWFPYNLWLLNTKSIGRCYNYNDTVYSCSIKKSRPMMCLNRTPVWHRIYLLMQIYNKPWFNQIDYSCSVPIDSYVGLLKSFTINRFFTDEEFETVEKHIIPLIPINLSGEQGIGGINSFPFMYNRGGTSVNLPAFDECAINLVTETSMNQGTALTEKTFKAFMAYQIPLIAGNTGANQYLEDLGFDMFSDYVPWKTWDANEDPKSRINAIVDWIESIMQNPGRILSKHREFRPRLIANHKWLFSPELTEKITNQLPQISSATNKTAAQAMLQSARKFWNLFPLPNRSDVILQSVRFR